MHDTHANAQADEMISRCTALGLPAAQVSGHPLADKVHGGDRWIAAQDSVSACRLPLTIAGSACGTGRSARSPRPATSVELVYEIDSA